MTAFVLLGYVMSHYQFGVFWPLFLFLLAHLLLMSILHWFFSEEKNVIRKAEVAYEHGKATTTNILKILYNCLINGFCNIYVHNFVSFENNKNERCHTFLRQFIFNAIFILENTVIIILFLTGIKDADIPKVILTVGIGFPFGVCLKLIYYKFYHLWKNNRAVSDLLPCSLRGKVHVV